MSQANRRWGFFSWRSTAQVEAGSDAAAPPAEETPAPSADRIGEFYADYSQPTRDEIDAVDPECAELFANSKVISVKRET